MERATNFKVRQPAFVNGLQEDVIEHEYAFGVSVSDVLVVRGRYEPSPKENARVLRDGFVELGEHRLCQITDDNLWRPTRRAEEHYTKDKLSTRRGAVHSIGWLCVARPPLGLERLRWTEQPTNRTIVDQHADGLDSVIQVVLITAVLQ